jgi:hypothetical protein
MGIMINGNGAASTANGRYRNMLFENNIFGPASGKVLHYGDRMHTVDGCLNRNSFTFRHNTMLYIKDSTFTSMWGREMAPQSYQLDSPTIKEDWREKLGSYSTYNNIFVVNDVSAQILSHSFNGANLIYKLDTVSGKFTLNGVETPLPYKSVVSGDGSTKNVIEKYLANGNKLGTLNSTAKEAIDAGVLITDDTVFNYKSSNTKYEYAREIPQTFSSITKIEMDFNITNDIYGNTRDDMPDIGATEY